MLPRAHRLRRSADFGSALRRGRRSARGCLVISLQADSDTAPPRVGLVVGRAVGGAVQRNRVKRRLRALLAARLDDLPPGSRLVVRALPGAGSASYAHLDDDLTGCLRRLTSTTS